MNLFPSRLLSAAMLLVAGAVAHAQSDRQPTSVAPGIPVGAVQAQPAPGRIVVSQRESLTSSNSFALGASASQVPERAIQPVPGGGRADFGLQKAFFPVDVKGEQTLTITTPEGRVLACRATFLALHDLASGQNVLIAEVTNRIGAIVGRDQVVYTNAFDTIRADIRYRYTSYSLEQDIVLHEHPVIPDEFSPENTRLEIWTEWFDSAPVSVAAQTIDLRANEASGLLNPALAAD